MEFATPEIQRRYTLIVEGQCPNECGPLERRDSYGFCHACKLGWAVRGDMVEMHQWQALYEFENEPPAEVRMQRPDHKTE